MRRYRRITIMFASFVLLFVIVAIGVPLAKAGPVHLYPPEDQVRRQDPISRGTLSQTAPLPPPEQDTCQHCHLAGSIENMWTPVWRWLLFGSLGMVFVFGAFRAGSVWVHRRPWKPLSERIAHWLDERYAFVEPLGEILNKPIPIFATHWMYCLGGITFMLFLIQGITGVMLAFYYRPTPEEAYASIQFIENEVRFGAGIRAIHHWAANGMIVMVVAHMVRVFITGAFKPPRELNWISGVILFLITLIFGFTGYLLPWDQRAFWATTVGTEIGGGIPQVGDLVLVFLRGGWEVSGVTLSRFYALHILIMPALIIFFLATHFLMVRRQGIARPL